MSFVAFDVGETLIEYRGVALDWSAHYRPALVNALCGTPAATDEQALDAAQAVLGAYNTRRHPRRVEAAEGEVTQRIAELCGVAVEPFARRFFAYFQRRAVAMPGAARLLADLRRDGHYLGALSDVPYAMPTRLLRQDLGDLAAALDRVASSCEIGERKPSGKGLRDLLAQSGCTPRGACYVGNEAKDMAAARDAGMRGILLVTNGDLPDYGQTHSVRALTEVAALVDGV